MCKSVRALLFTLVFFAQAVASTATADGLSGNLNADTIVDVEDLRIFADQWLGPGCPVFVQGCADLDGENDGVDYEDYAVLAANWLKHQRGQVVISEFMADNDKTIADEDGDYPDWIELLNISATTVDLSGWYLRDNGTQWQLPSGVSLEPGQSIVVFASGKDRTTDPNHLHTSFQLDRGGDYLALVRPDGVAIEYQFWPAFPPQREDISYGLEGHKTTLISESSPISVLVPTGDIGTDWRGGNEPFDETGWTSGSGGVGYSTTAEADLQAYWAFDVLAPTAVDSSNYGRDGTIYGASWTTAGRIGYALDFDGDNDYVSVNVPGYMNQMTLSMWVNFDFVTEPNPPEGTVVAPFAHVGQETGAVDFIIDSWGYLHFNVAGVSNDCELTSSETITLHNWHHLLVTYDDVNHFGQIYLDGEPAGFTVNMAGPALIGNSTIASKDGDNFCDARFDEVAIWSRTLDQREISQLAAGVTADNIYRYDGIVTTDIESTMHGNNSSAYMRYHFYVPDVCDVQYLTLRVAYDDGFVAYLNGTEVARDNAPASIQWNSAATDSRPNQQCMQYRDFNLTPNISSLKAGDNILAVQGLNREPFDEDFLVRIQLNAYTLSSDTLRYFIEPTPGSGNVSGYEGFVADTRFSVDRGYYHSPFDVTINTDTPGAIIKYTLDFSEPNETHGLTYTGPIPITTTTCLRAMAYKPGLLPTNVDTQTYIFPSDVAVQPPNPPGLPSTWKNGFPADYEVGPDVVNNTQPGYGFEDALASIPTISIVTDHDHLWSEETGIYYNDSPENEWAVKEQNNRLWERPTSVEIIYPDPNAGDGYQLNCGVRIHGAITRSHDCTPKHSFRLFFRGEYGARKLVYSFFPDSDVDRFDQLVLRACSSDSWTTGGGNSEATYIKDQWMRDTMRDMRHPASHGIYVHLYLNGLYWGLYNVCERLHASFWAEHYGGQKQEYDVLKDWVELHSGSMDAWNEMVALAEQGLESNEAYQRIQGNNPDGTRNPDYPVYLDVDNLIDYMIVHIFAGAVDWPGHNWWAARRRGPESEGFRFTIWDQEGVLESLGTYGKEDRSDPGPAFLYDRLRQNPQFRMRFADRLHKYMFNGGLLSQGPNQQRWTARIDEIDKAIVAESARWGDAKEYPPFTREDNWLDAVNWVSDTFFTSIHSPALQRFRNVNLYPDVEAPTFYINGQYQHGGYISTPASLTITAPAGTIYYTTDGNDPYEPPLATSSVTLVPEDADKTVLVPTSGYPSGTAWRTNPAYDDSGWTDYSYVGGKTGGVGYERGSGYQDYISYDVESELYGVNTSCYIRIPFTVTAEDLDGANTLTLKMRYDDGFVAYLNGIEVTRANFTGTPEWDSRADDDERESSSFADFDISAHIGDLNVGSNLLAIHGLNADLGSSDLLLSAKLIISAGSGGGPSDSAIVYDGSPVTLTETTQVKARAVDAGQWSALNEAVYAAGSITDDLRVTEIMYHPEDKGNPLDPNTEFIELKNTGAESINLNLVRFTEGIGFTFGDIQLDPGQYVVVVKDINAFAARYPSFSGTIAGQYTGRLDNGGEQITLQDATGATIQQFRYKDGWYSITDGGGFSLTIIDPNDPDPNSWGEKSAWRPSAVVGGSPGTDDSGLVPNPGDIVINEVLAHSHDDADWIELHNTTDSPINIGGWFLSDSDSNLAKYEIADGTVIPVDGYIVFYEDSNFANPNDPGCLIPFALSESGEEVSLVSAQGGILTGYQQLQKFGASQTNVAFGRHVTSTGEAHFVAVSSNTPWGQNAPPKVGPLVITEIMYHPQGAQNTDAEYVELYNTTDSTVYLYDIEGNPWKFEDDDSPGIDYLFPPDANVPPGGYILLVKSLDAFNVAGYPAVPPGVQMFEWVDGKLSNGGQQITIGMPGDLEDGERRYIAIDTIEYDDTAPWPTSADGGGDSLHRKVNTDYGNDPVNWQALPPTPGW